MLGLGWMGWIRVLTRNVLVFVWMSDRYLMSLQYIIHDSSEYLLPVFSLEFVLAVLAVSLPSKTSDRHHLSDSKSVPMHTRHRREERPHPLLGAFHGLSHRSDIHPTIADLRTCCL